MQIPSHWRHPLALGALLAVALTATSGCAHQHEALEKRLAALEAGLEDLKRGDRSTAVRLEDIENRMLLIRDEIDTRRTVLYRDRATTPAASPGPTYHSYGDAPLADALPTVRLSPPVEERPPARSEPSAPFTYDAIDSLGYRVEGGLATGEAPPVYDELPSVQTAFDPIDSSTPPVPPALSPREEQRAAGEYRKAYELTTKGKYEQARKAFESFVAKYPTHQLADNSYYWMGECLYAQKRYLEALQAFQTVIRDYPDGNKVPDAMLKTGLCYQNLGEMAHARRVLDQVVEMYPQSAPARVARERVLSMR